MSQGNWRRGTVFFAVLITITFVAALLVRANNDEKSGGSSDPTTTSSAPAPEGNDYDRDELLKLVTVRTTSVDCLAVARKHHDTQAVGDTKVIKFRNGANASVARGERIEGGVNTPLVGDTDPARLESAIHKVCSDPLYACGVGRSFGVWEPLGPQIARANPWIGKNVKKSDDDINDCAVRLTRIRNVDDMSDDELADAIVSRDRKVRVFTEKVATLIDRFRVDGTRPEQSVRNYHLSGEGIVAGSFPNWELNPQQEKLPALVLALVPKGACGPVMVIGFNLFDARPEEFAPPTCTDTPTTPTTPPSGGCRNCGGGTTTTRPVVTTTTTTSCASGKCVPPTTVSPSPTTRPPAVTTTQPDNGGQGDSGDGATNTVQPPTTVDTAPAPPTTASPTTNPPKP
ncbi:MAG: hypothetical protein AAB459_01805 [Patescibacteria group bacterium]